jgi:hypothetical protein
MNKDHLRPLVALAAVFALALTVGFTTAGGSSAATPLASGAPGSAVAQAGGWVFEGCWTYWPAGPCRDVYRDAAGQYWICKACGTTGNPSPGKCSRISIQTLNIGYWCS